MVYRGRIRNGVVVFESAPPLPNGTEFRVEPLIARATPPPDTGNGTIWDRLRALAGTAHNLPCDLADHHDHYRRERHG